MCWWLVQYYSVPWCSVNWLILIDSEWWTHAMRMQKFGIDYKLSKINKQMEWRREETTYGFACLGCLTRILQCFGFQIFLHSLLFLAHNIDHKNSDVMFLSHKLNGKKTHRYQCMNEKRFITLHTNRHTKRKNKIANCFTINSFYAYILVV